MHGSKLQPMCKRTMYKDGLVQCCAHASRLSKMRILLESAQAMPKLRGVIWVGVHGKASIWQRPRGSLTESLIRLTCPVCDAW